MLRRLKPLRDARCIDTNVSIGIRFYVSANRETLVVDLKPLTSTPAIANEPTVAVIVDVPGPQGDPSFIGAYSELFPDFLVNSQSQLRPLRSYRRTLTLRMHYRALG